MYSKGRITMTTNDTTQMAPAATDSVAVEKISDEDKAVLDKVKAQRELVLERAKAALSANEAAELAHQNVILQLAMKYKLDLEDQINEKGEIVRKKDQK